MPDPMDTINRMLGEHEAAIRNMETNHKRCGETLGGKVASIETEVKAVRIDIKGLQDQMAGSLEYVSDIDKQLQDHCQTIQYIEKDRTQRWMKHDNQCKECITNMKEQTKAALDEYFQKPENMGPIALCKKYWWIVAIGFVMFMMLFQFRPETLHFFMHDVLHIGSSQTNAPGHEK